MWSWRGGCPRARSVAPFSLIDLFCLGDEDAFYRELPPFEFQPHVERLGEAGRTVVSIDPASAKAALMGAVAFAAACGLDEAAATEHFTFGREGKRLFVPDPRDSMTRIREFGRALTRAVGDGRSVDPVLGMNTAERLALQGAVDLLGGGGSDDGLVIDHGGATDAVDDATVLREPPDPSEDARVPSAPTDEPRREEPVEPRHGLM